MTHPIKMLFVKSNVFASSRFCLRQRYDFMFAFKHPDGEWQQVYAPSNATRQERAKIRSDFLDVKPYIPSLPEIKDSIDAQRK